MSEKRLTVKVNTDESGTWWLGRSSDKATVDFMTTLSSSDRRNLYVTLHTGDLPPDPRSNEGLQMAAGELSKLLDDYCTHRGYLNYICLWRNGLASLRRQCDDEVVLHATALTNLLTTLAQRPAPKTPTLAEDWATVKQCSGWAVSIGQQKAFDRVNADMTAAGFCPCALWMMYRRAASGGDEERTAIAAIDEWVAGREGK